jgi:hypothetical protein
MNRFLLFEGTVCLVLSLFIAGCERKITAQDNALAATTGLTPTTVRPDFDSNNFKVEYPEQFPP